MSRCDSHWKAPALSAAQLGSLERVSSWHSPAMLGMGRHLRGHMAQVLWGNPSQICLYCPPQHTPDPWSIWGYTKWKYLHFCRGAWPQVTHVEVSVMLKSVWSHHPKPMVHLQGITTHNLEASSEPPLRARLELFDVQVVSGDLSSCPWRITQCGKGVVELPAGLISPIIQLVWITGVSEWDFKYKKDK